MDNIRQVISEAFNTKNTSITFSEPFFTDEVRADVLLNTHKSSCARWKNFLILKTSRNTPFFHSIYMQDFSHLDKFNQMFNMHKNSRKDFIFINEFLNSFQQNVNFSKFLKLNGEIKPHEFYTFTNTHMLNKDVRKHGITTCVHRSYRNVVQYEFIKNFSVNRDGKIALFPTVRFFNHTNPFSLYFSLAHKKVYKLPDNFMGLVYLEDIVEASTLFTDQDIDIFTEEILMMYVSKLHQNIYQDFLNMPESNISDKIDLFLMTTI